MLQPDQYQSALAAIPDYTQLKTILIAVNDFIVASKYDQTQSKLHDWITTNRPTIIAIEGQPSLSVPGLTIYKGLVKPTTKPPVDQKARNREKQQMITYLLLFYEKFQVRVACHNVHNQWVVRVVGPDQYQVLGPDHDESSVYDLFYWRTKKNEIGIAKLSISPDWQKARLVYHYLTPGPDKETALLEGSVYSQGDGKVTRYVHLHDANQPFEDNPLQLFLSLHVPEQEGKRLYLAGVFATSNRDHEGWGPVCGRVILRLNNTNPDLFQSGYIERKSSNQKGRVRVEDIPDEIYYAVSNQRLRVSTSPILGLEDMPFGTDTKPLKELAGTYRVYQPQPSGIREMQLTINANGKAELQKYKGKKGTTTGFVYYCANSMAIRLDYQEEEALYRYHLFVEPVPDSGHLQGIMAGLNSEKEVFSTRLFLKRIAETETVNTQPTQLVDAHYIDQLTVTEPAVARFLLDTALTSTDAAWTAHLATLAVKPFSDSQGRNLSLLGQFSAFFMTKIEIMPRPGGDLDHKERLPEQRIQLIQMPVILYTDRAEVTLGRRKITGGLFYDGCNGLTIVFDDGLLWGNLLLTIPMPGSSASTQYRYHYGILSRLMNGEPEASALVLYPEPETRQLVDAPTPEQEQNQDVWCYRQFEQMSELLEIERRYKGLASMLFGDWGRFTRMPGYQKTRVQFPLKYDTFRQTFFAAACHYATQNDIRRCKENLTRALRHGFAMYQYASLTPNDKSFPEPLRLERATLRDAYKAIFSNFPVLQRYIDKHWKIGQFASELT